MTINGITWTLYNTSSGTVSGSGWKVGHNETYPPTTINGITTGVTIKVLTPDMIKAINSGLLTATPSTPSLTTSVGTASSSGTIVDTTGSYSQILLNNNFATISTVVNALFNTVQQLQYLTFLKKSKLNS